MGIVFFFFIHFQHATYIFSETFCSERQDHCRDLNPSNDRVWNDWCFKGFVHSLRTLVLDRLMLVWNKTETITYTDLFNQQMF